MLFDERIYKFMYAALTEAENALDEDEVPIGAVVVHNDRIIGRGYNQTQKLNDPTAHAEMLALTAAANHLQSKYLTECEIFITIEPCVMCTGAMLNARIGTLYFGSYEPKFGACGSLYNLANDGKYNHTIKVYNGIYSDESKYLMRQYFEKKRKYEN